MSMQDEAISELEDLSQPQKDRLAFIELHLQYFGEIQRQDLVARFGIQTAAATRDLALYRGLAGQNVVFDTRTKRYFLAETFKPLFTQQTDRVLAWLTQGFGDGEPAPLRSAVSCEIPARITQPPLDTLAAVTRAIHKQAALKVTYHSISSGKTQREIVPHALIDTGLRWHVRAFDRKTQDFRDFVIARIVNPVLVADADRAPAEHERTDHDIQWTRIVELELVPHPDQPRPEITVLDYNMRGGSLKVRARAATAGYMLRKWSVDCSPDHSLRGVEFRLWLKDHLALYGVRNAVLAPGYRH